MQFFTARGGNTNTYDKSPLSPYNPSSTQGVYITFYSGSGFTNYKTFPIGAESLSDYISASRFYCAFVNVNSTATFNQGGSFNSADVRAVEFTFSYSSTPSNMGGSFLSGSGQGRFLIPTNTLYFVSPITVFGGSRSTPAAVQEIKVAWEGTGVISEGINAEGRTVYGQNGNAIASRTPINIGQTGQNVAWIDSDFEYSFWNAPSTSTNALVSAPNGYLGIEVTLGSTSIFELKRGSISGGVGLPAKFVFNGHASVTPIFENINLINLSTVQLHSTLSYNGGSIINCGEVVPNGATFTNVQFSGSVGASSLALNLAVSLVNCTFLTAAVAGVRIVQAGDYSARAAIFSSNVANDILVDILSPGTGQTYNIDISGFSAAAGTTTPSGTRIRVADSTASNTYNITVNSTYSSSNASSAGATVNIIAPAVTVTLTSIIQGSEVRIYATGTQTEMAGNEAIAGTTFEFDPTGAYDIRIFRAGYQPFRSINNAVPSADASTQIAQLIDRGYSDET